VVIPNIEFLRTTPKCQKQLLSIPRLYAFCPHCWEFDNGFTRTVGNLEYLKKKVKFLGVHQGGMITVGIDLMI
jgi:hypothetical protein